MKIAVLVSGGVDSSVALQLLQSQGHDLTAFYIKIWLEDELSYLGSCPWQEDLAYVESVCKQLDVPLQVVSLQKEYFEYVVNDMVSQVKSGQTPNPDILCNQRIKFGMFLDLLDPSFDKVASGHYAQVFEQDGLYYLKRSPDAIKDQTYFLSYLSQEQLSRVLFPIGHLLKEEVRALAHHHNLPNKNRKDSQGICFLGKLKFNDFIKQYLGEREGDLLEYETGKKMGTHKGFWFHTIGQRQGLGLAGGPWYVVRKDTANNIVYISRAYYSEDKKRDRCMIGNVKWLTAQSEKTELQVKLRHGAMIYDCEFYLKESGEAELILNADDQGIAPGQFAVLYDGELCLGAGVIVGN